VSTRLPHVVLAALAVLALVLAAPAAAAPRKPPDLSDAGSAILIDQRDGSVITAKDPGERRAMASTTKLMTALLTLERTKPSQVIAAANYHPAAVESKINLRPGERMKVSDLFTGMLLPSANDAAETLAEGIAGSRAAFVREMNQRARQLGLRNTSYGNPIGLDDRHTYTTARDLSMLARHLMTNHRFASTVDRPSAVLTSGSHRRVVDNRNDLVGRYAYVKGVKTGHTSHAGYVLVGAARNAEGAEVISVVMGAPSEAARDADSLALLQYGLSRFSRRQVLDADVPVASAKVQYRDERTHLVPAEDRLVLVRKGEKVTKRIRAPKELGKKPAGARVGTIDLVRDGKVIERVPLVTEAAVPGAGPLRIVTHALGPALTLLAILLIVSGMVFVVTRTRRRRRERERAERRRARNRARAQAEGGSE
jgi:D-alanyl-D-alanine carboxypeptidase (penicillin-binding protein 5/6)